METCDGNRNETKHNLKEIKDDQLGCMSKMVQLIKSNLFLVLNIIGIILGFVIGLLVRMTDPGEDALMWLGMPGELYMRILKCIILPLIVCSVIDGTANTDPKTNGKLGLAALGYIICSNAMGATLGVITCLAVRPGEGVDQQVSDGGVDTRNLQTIDIVADFIRNIFPPNMVGAALDVSQTKYTPKYDTIEVNITGQLMNQTSKVMVKSLGTVSSTNILGLIVISAALGIAASQTGEQGKPFVAFFKSGAFVIFKLFAWIKWTTPLGSASLIAASLAEIENLGPALRSVGMFTLVIVLGEIILLQLVILSVVFVVVKRQNPLKFFTATARAWFMAFGAQNSTLPYTEYLQVLSNFGVNTRVSEYVLPLCVTLNRVGSAFFITATSLFMAQYIGVSLGAGDLLTIGMLGLLSSLAIPAVNSSSVVAIVIILESMGVSTEGTVGLVMAMEWINDRVRATSNGMAHMSCVLTTWRICRKDMNNSIQELPGDDDEKMSMC